LKNRSHEDFAEYSVVEGPSDRKFGLTVGGVLALIGMVRWLAFDAGRTSAAIILSVGFALILAAIVAPGLLRHLNSTWMKLGLLLSRIVNPIVMLLLFVFIFVPVGFVMRVAGRDALGVRRSSETGNYWIKRDPPGPAPETIIHQF